MDTYVTELASLTVVIAEEAEGVRNRIGGRGRAPHIGKVNALPAQDAEDISLSKRVGDELVAAVDGVLGEGEFGAGVVLSDPALETGNKLHGAVEVILFDPGAAVVCGVPEGACGGELGGGVGELRVIVLVKVVQGASAIGFVVGSHLLEIVLSGVEVILLAGSADPTTEGKVGWPKDGGGGILLLDHSGVLLAEGDDGAVRGGGWFDVAVGIAPAGGLVIELVEGDASLGSGAEGCDKVLNPALLQSGGVVDVVGIDIRVEELGAVAADAIAAVLAVGVDIRVGGLLGAVDRSRKAAGPRGCAVDVGDDGDGDERSCRRVSADHGVGGRHWERDWRCRCRP